MAAEVRSSWLKYVVGLAKKRAAGRDALLAELAPVRGQIRHLSLLSWAPARLLTELCVGLETSLGEWGADEFWVEQFLDSYSSVLVRPMLVLTGNTPEALHSRAPRVWRMLTSECGEFSVELRPNQSVVTLSDLPDELRHMAVVRMMKSGFVAPCTRASRTGKVSVEARDLSRGTVTFDTTWAQPSTRPAARRAGA